jgi:hypothetical protein
LLFVGVVIGRLHWPHIEVCGMGKVRHVAEGAGIFIIKTTVPMEMKK